ncbi:putative cytochrome p450 family protein [Neofusicoccum parvum UCRNP2]|uniref:Putative cytochrome p450 family protein n=1 Tax=Botryosphaeria parva (strain UCR-NP2) TaxID=1287680 RepID=R1GMB6_BOTPV|nr:putative cytochrome p450 family protein [Neofusicoccum parvum UCRNP2]
METMKTLEPYVNETVKVLLKKMEDTGTNGRVIEFAYLTHLFAFDVIGEVTFARRFGYIEAGSDFGLFGTIAKTLLSGVWVGEIPWLYHLHQRLVPLIGNHLAINARNGYLHDFTLKQMAARKERAAAGADDHNSDILSKLLAASRAKPQLSESDIGFTLTSNVIAGSDTTAVSMSAIVYYLLVTPAAKDRLLRELREKVVAGDVDADGIVPAAVGEKWPFLQAVIHEGMRMHPALGGLLARVVPPAGLRNKDIFGDDVETFRPERWLDEKRKTDMHRFFFGFGGGSRTCVGKNISMLELNKVIPTLFLRFDLQISNDKPGPEERFYS